MQHRGFNQGLRLGKFVLHARRFAQIVIETIGDRFRALVDALERQFQRGLRQAEHRCGDRNDRRRHKRLAIDEFVAVCARRPALRQNFRRQRAMRPARRCRSRSRVWLPVPRMPTTC